MADENDPEGIFDDDPTPVTTVACTTCGRSTDSVCVGCGNTNRVVVACDPPSRETLRLGKQCFLSPGLWLYCCRPMGAEGEEWFSVSPVQPVRTI